MLILRAYQDPSPTSSSLLLSIDLLFKTLKNGHSLCRIGRPVFSSFRRLLPDLDLFSEAYYSPSFLTGYISTRSGSANRIIWCTSSLLRIHISHIYQRWPLRMAALVVVLRDVIGSVQEAQSFNSSKPNSQRRHASIQPQAASLE
jgi:hypothetical protein